MQWQFHSAAPRGHRWAFVAAIILIALTELFIWWSVRGWLRKKSKVVLDAFDLVHVLVYAVGFYVYLNYAFLGQQLIGLATR